MIREREVKSLERKHVSCGELSVRVGKARAALKDVKALEPLDMHNYLKCTVGLATTIGYPIRDRPSLFLLKSPRSNLIRALLQK